MKTKLIELFGYVLLINLVPCVQLSDANDQILTKFIISSWGNGAPQLEIKLPQDWDYQQQKGPDFDVHWFTDQKTKENIGFYIGHHPNIKKSTDVKHLRRNVGNIETEFYSENQGGKIFTQSIVQGFFKGHAGSGVAELIIHIMINSYGSNFDNKAFEYLKTVKIIGSG
jgi:hypothetical protein